MDIFEWMKKGGHEQIIFNFDRETGMRSIIAIHNSTLGQTYGGTRMVNYASMEDALQDALRLSRAMTYKCAVADEDKGGAKAVIWGDPEKDKSEGLFRAFGRFVEMLGGRFVTGEDVNVTPADSSLIGRETRYIVSEEEGTPTTTGITTAYGVYVGLEACAKFLWGDENLKGRKIALQGLGAVGGPLLNHLREGGLEIIATDIDHEKLERVQDQYGVRAVEPDSAYEVECDIFCPCAMGGVLNDRTIPRLDCEVVAGSANNQLEDEDLHSRMLHELGILFAPDFIINAGGLIHAVDAHRGYNEERVRMKTKRIYGRLLHIFQMAKRENIPPLEAAKRYAESRIRELHELRRLYVPGCPERNQ